MGKMIIEAATSLDGFWIDTCRTRLMPMDELRKADQTRLLLQSCGAIVIGKGALDRMGGLPAYRAVYGFDGPVFVVADNEPETEAEDAKSCAVASFSDAFKAARITAGDSAVLVVGEAQAMNAALASGNVDEIRLDVFDRHSGMGTPLFSGQSPGGDYFVSKLETVPGLVTMTLERR